MAEKDKIDWSRFEVRIPIDRDAETISELWLTQENLENWFLKKAEFTAANGEKRKRAEKIKPGDSYSWQWHGWPESVEEHGKLLEPHDGEFLRFIFGKAGTVGVSIKKEKNRSILHLSQVNIPQDEESKMNFYVGCKTGWTFYLLNLKSIILDGPDLRNKYSELQTD